MIKMFILFILTFWTFSCSCQELGFVIKDGKGELEDDSILEEFDLFQEVNDIALDDSKEIPPDLQPEIIDAVEGSDIFTQPDLRPEPVDAIDARDSFIDDLCECTPGQTVECIPCDSASGLGICPLNCQIPTGSNCTPISPYCCSNSDCSGCTGTPLPCYNYNNETDCTQHGCNWRSGGDDCYGPSIMICGSFINETECNNHNYCGCSWNVATCTGTIRGCNNFESGEECVNCGCNWRCSGTPYSCSTFTDQTSCGNQDGCQWRTCDDDSSSPTYHQCI